MPRYVKGAEYAAQQAARHEAKLLKMYGCDIEAFLASCRESITMLSGGPGMVTNSLLSDVQELIAAGCHEEARQMLNRVKRWTSDSIIDPFVSARRLKDEAAAKARKDDPMADADERRAFVEQQDQEEQ
jgi:hypothetical protein